MPIAVARTLPLALSASPALAGSLADHRAALGACRRCAAHLPPGVRPVLPEAEHPLAMLVGQAPGPREADTGRPFLGRSGQTLWAWLGRAGLDEAEARRILHICAVTRCYPGPHPSGRGDRVAGPAERAACAPWLEAELALVRPPLVIPVGRLAADRFLGPRPLADLVGRAHEVELAHGPARVIPLPHPSGASGWLHAPAHRALLDRALDLLAAELATLRTPAGRAEGAVGAASGAALGAASVTARARRSRSAA